MTDLEDIYDKLVIISSKCAIGDYKELQDAILVSGIKSKYLNFYKFLNMAMVEHLQM